MNIYEANMFDSRKLNLRLFTNAMPESRYVCWSLNLTGSYTPHIELTRGKNKVMNSLVNSN